MREVLARVLGIKGHEVVHCGSLYLNLRHKFLKLNKGDNVLKDDNWRSHEKDEFKHCMKTVSRVSLYLLGAKDRERLIREAAEEDVLTNHVVKKSVRAEIGLKYNGGV